MASRRLAILGFALLVTACAGSSGTPHGTATNGALTPQSAAASIPTVTLAPGVTPRPSGAWITFTPADQSFEIQMPAVPTETKKTLTVSGGATVPETTEMVLNPGGKTGYLVAWVDYTAASLAGKSADSLLAEGQASQVAGSSGGQIVSQSQIDLNGHPGRTWSVLYSGGTVECRAYLVATRMYLLEAIIGPNDDPNGAGVFFNSFTLKS